QDRRLTMVLPDSSTERARQGAEVRRKVLGAAFVAAGRKEANPFTQHFIDFTQSQCWGYAWLRDGLSHKTRSMLNVCLLAGLGRWPEFEVHIRGALPTRSPRFSCTPRCMPESRLLPTAFAAPTRSSASLLRRRRARVGPARRPRAERT